MAKLAERVPPGLKPYQFCWVYLGGETLASLRVEFFPHHLKPLRLEGRERQGLKPRPTRSDLPVLTSSQIPFVTVPLTLYP